MEKISLFNDIIGPVMRGPSSSHTAGSYRIGRIARDLLGAEPEEAEFRFHPDGSYAKVITQQGVDRGLAAGLLGWDITDERFLQVLDAAKQKGLTLSFATQPFAGADHPNTVDIRLKGAGGKSLHAMAQSVGGGLIRFTRIEDWPLLFSGKNYTALIQFPDTMEDRVAGLLKTLEGIEETSSGNRGRDRLILVQSRHPAEALKESLKGIPEVHVRTASPVFFVCSGERLFASAKEMIAYCKHHRCSLSEAAVIYESELLGLSPEEVREEMERRYSIMKASISSGLETETIRMQLLQPSAGKILSAEKDGRVSLGGPHTRAAARALAVLHTSSSMGTICAAPTGASAGVLPAVLSTYQEEKGLSDRETSLSLFAAAAIGLVVAERATFAAEVAGCQVEIGAAGAMAAAAVVDLSGGTASQAADAAAISFHNSMGSVCDLIQGVCEIPCHTRNAAASAGAFVSADLILGGYSNPIPLDETVDAVMKVGLAMPPELRVTSLGGLAVTPSAMKLKRRET